MSLESWRRRQLRRYSYARRRDVVSRGGIVRSGQRCNSGRGTGVLHLLATPDLDADGTGELIAVVSRFDGRDPHEAAAGLWRVPTRIHVDAISGKRGQKLWHWQTELKNADPNADSTPIQPVFWWGRGSDGWPLLAVPIGGDLAPGVTLPRVSPFSTPDPPVVHFLAGATGHEEHTVPGLSWPKTGDLDGDGMTDLSGARSTASCAPFAVDRPSRGVFLTGCKRPATSTATA